MTNPWAKQKAAAISNRKRASKFEEKFEKSLIASGIRYVYEAVKVCFTPPLKTRTKTWDWLITNKSGKMWVAETKGYWERKVRIAETCAIKQNPDVDVRYIFQRAKTPIAKGSKTTYAIWCDKHDILWAEGTIPSAWLDE
jgi:hypothetical protein